MTKSRFFNTNAFQGTQTRAGFARDGVLMGVKTGMA